MIVRDGDKMAVRRFKVLAISLLIGTWLSPLSVQAAPPGWKAKELPAAEEKQWIDAVKNRPTADGATVLQVLEYAQQLRPARFKFGAFEIGYNGESAKPQTVSVSYWIGAKRLADDYYTDLGYDMKRDGGKLIVTAPQNPYTTDTIMNALEQGRTPFLLYIDAMYRETCIDSQTKAKLC